MAAELPRPGVEVIQVFRSTSPTVVTPTLVPCVVGVCKQIVDVLVPADGGGNQINTDALISLPAILHAADATGNPAQYAGIDGDDLVLSINNGPDVTVTFDGATLTPAAVVEQILAAFLAQGVTEATAEVVGDGFRIKSVGVGEFQTIEVRPATSPSVLAAFGFVAGYVFVGSTAYDQDFLKVPQASFPDPRGNLSELAIEASSIRVFLGMGSGTNLVELSRTQSYLRRGGNGTAAQLTGAVALAGLTYATAAFFTGNADATDGALYGGGGTLDGLTIILVRNGISTTLTLDGTTNAANQAALLAAIESTWPGVTASINATNLRITGAVGDVISVGAGTANAALGIGGLTLNGAGAVDDKTLLVKLDGGAPITVTFGKPQSANELVQQFNDALGGVYGSISTGLRITSKTQGASSKVEIIGGTAVTPLGFAAPNNTASGTSGIKVVDDGNGDAVSPLVELTGYNLTAPGTAAVVTGLVDLSSLTLPGDLDGLTLKMSVNGREPQTLVFDAPANQAAILDQLNAFWGGQLTATANGNQQLVLTSNILGEESTFKIIEGTALPVLGLVPSVTGQRLLTDIAPDFTALNTKKLRVDLNGTIVEHTFSGLTGGSTASDVATSLNTTLGANGTAEVVSGALRIRLNGTAAVGQRAYVRVVAASSNEAAFLLGFDVNQRGEFFRFNGGGFPPASGDDFYVDGSLVGRITQVAPGGNTARIRLDKQIPITSALGDKFTMVAKNLSPGNSGRPNPELVVDLQGDPQLKHDLLRDTIGNPLEGKAPIYLSYRAVRQDVSPRARNPNLLKLDNTSQLESLLAPVNVNNPLALGLQFALQNAPGCQVQGLGVDAISADAPFGTVEAFTRAAEFLEAYEVYAIAPLTHDEAVAQVFNTHVTAMSAPAAKGERICLFNFSAPTKKLDTLVASGLSGNTIGSSGTVFDTGIVNLPALVLSAGINPVGTIPVSSGLFIDIASDNKRYSVASISGSQVTIRTTFAAGENDDGFYATTDFNDPPLPSALINEPFAVRVRGASLVRPDGTLDKQGIAETYQGLGQSFLNRRFWSIVPDKAAAIIGGIEQEVDGFYMCAAIAGMIGQQPPQQSFTNFPMTGFTKVIGSNGYFTEKQLNIIAAGGNYIVVQDVEGAPLTSRMALTTDMTSIETRTDSVVKVVDFTAKFMRSGLKNYIGRFNITQGFLDSLGHVVQGLLQFLTDIGVLIGANMNNIVQDENVPDTVLIDVTLDVPYPCNYIRLTLVI